MNDNLADNTCNKSSHNNSDDDDELPNLAKLVAATVRDRVVLEQMEEIQALRSQLNASQRVEITGPNGSPVYARGCFSNGDFNASSLQSIDDDEQSSIDETGLFWDVGLQTVGGSDNCDGGNNKTNTVPLNKLSNIEIRIGGVLYVTSGEVEGTSMAFGIRPGNKFDFKGGERDMSRSAVCEFNTEDNTGASSGGRAALLTFHIRDFPRGHWRSLQSVAMLNRSIALRQQDREEEREERREIWEVERRERIEHGEIDVDDAEEYESDVDDEDDQDPLDVFNYLTLCLSKRHPGQRADITSVSLCVKSVRGRIENINSRGEDFQNIKENLFRKIDEMYQEELDGVESVEDEFATLTDA
eukprot:CAMPEP_0172317026 /NCGR_PEP_ID=MMETSP1058-20130122/30307_1 /TAXON_ID=83371 /ORGANISM="Detonula confervacea, Strain CCMP 353" /LENGTH=356 /DNA_ID=CAMNT_0013031479 /DNA_START=40 /DNA_END=1110 /DNA_ORIENTATION=-